MTSDDRIMNATRTQEKGLYALFVEWSVWVDGSVVFFGFF